MSGQRMHVAVIGGGLGGISAATHLAGSPPRGVDLSITVIDPKAHVEIPWAAVRALFDPAVARAFTIPMSAVLAKYPCITHVRASAAALSLAAVTLDDGRSVPFDACLVATGSARSFAPLEPGAAAPRPHADPEESIAARRADIVAAGDALVAAKSVLVIGGGGIGAELAGDLAAYADLRRGNKPAITLVHSADHLVPEFSPTAAAKLQAKLQARGVRVVLNDRAVETDGKWLLEKVGETLDVETVVKCVGVKPTAAFFEKGGLGSCLDDNGWVKVDDNFRVVGAQGKIFATGDCCTPSGKRSGAGVLWKKAAVARNISTTLSALAAKQELGQLTKLKKGTDPPDVFLITVGPNDGIAQTPMGAVTFFLPWFKNKTMFFFKAKADLGL